jgi:hypothetical protein
MGFEGYLVCGTSLVVRPIEIEPSFVVLGVAACVWGLIVRAPEFEVLETKSKFPRRAQWVAWGDLFRVL